MPSEALAANLRELAQVSVAIRETGSKIGAALREAELQTCQRIRQQRIDAGLSQGEVADYMRSFGFDMQQSTVAKVEAGKRSLRVSELSGFATALNVPVLSLLVDPEAGFIAGSVGASATALESFLVEEEAAKRRAEDKMLSQLRTTAKIYAMHDARSVLLASQMRDNGADAIRAKQTVSDESPA